MRNNNSNIDGFVVRRRPQNSDLSRQRPTLDRGPIPSQYLIDPAKTNATAHPAVPGLSRAGGPGAVGAAGMALPPPKRPESINVDMTLDDTPPPAKRIGKPKVRRWNRKRIIKTALIVAALGLLVFGGYFGYKFLLAGGKIVKGNIIGAIFSKGKELKMDTNGRTNVLLFGTSEDDPGHDGKDLTDSMMVASIDQKKKDIFLVSIPRDLWVDYGRACPAGYKGKINALYSCVKTTSEEAGQEALRKAIGDVLGLDIQYGVHVNYTALRQAVDAIGGITVTIDSKDPRGILDRNFDWDCPKGLFTCYNVKYPNGPVTLNGKQALYLARARGANGLTYGLAQANFDREGYQRKILIAIKDKAVSAGTLTNPVAVNGLLDTLGNNVRTNFDADEVKTLVKLGQDIKTQNIASMVLNDPDSSLVTTGNIGGQSMVQPQKGLFDYSEIQAVALAYATGDTAGLEKARVDVLNASGQAGAAQAQADALIQEKIKIGIVGNAPVSAGTQAVQLIDVSGGKKPATLKKLQELLKVTATTTVPAGVTSSNSFIVIIGTKPASSANTQ